MDEIRTLDGCDMTFLNKVVYLRSEGRKEMGIGVSGSFVWFESLEGHEFWDKVYNGDLTKFNSRFKPEDYPHLDFICSLRPEILQEMTEEQIRQGNRADLMVFAKNNIASRNLGGFDWDKSKKGPKYWVTIVGREAVCAFNERSREPNPSSSSSPVPEDKPEKVCIHVRGKNKTFKPFIKITKIKSL